jgi:hypothetical protein
MLTHPTVEQLHQLGLAGMARAFAEFEANPTSAALSHAEWLALLLDREATERYWSDSNAWYPRLTEAMIFSGSAVQTKGFG